MSSMTKDPNVLMKQWMKIYINLNVLRSTNTNVANTLSQMKIKLAECNELVMKFFDLVEADPLKG